MKTFNAPAIEVIKFSVADIITVSGGEEEEPPMLPPNDYCL